MIRNLNITAITWNLQGKLPPYDQLLKLIKLPPLSQPDLILIATQQCQLSIQLSLLYQFKTGWETMLSQALPNYCIFSAHAMQGMHSCIFVNEQYRELMVLQKIKNLKAGLMGLTGSKGAISIQFSLLNLKFQMINCHLPAYQQNTPQRNKVLGQITNKIVNQDESYEVILMGDLNYRIDLPEFKYKQMTNGNQINCQQVHNYKSMIQLDQLHKYTKNILTKFQEGVIDFAPTYKMKAFSNIYINQRIPGWTDRIFHRKKRENMQPCLKEQSYGCGYQVWGSDHRPVFSVMKLQIPLKPHLKIQKMQRMHDYYSCCLI